MPRKPKAQKEKPVETASPALNNPATVKKFGTYPDSQSKEIIHWVLFTGIKVKSFAGKKAKNCSVSGFLKGPETFTDIFEVGEQVEMADLKGLQFNL
tara:strand:- start:7553 stop:7843 length:291 start_codon:yes stop_codon:yes gene_type:complete